MKLDIDFAPRSAAPNRLPIGLGATLLVMLILVIGSLSLDTEATSPPSTSAHLPDAKLEASNRAIDELNFPWLPLMSTLENSCGKALRLGRIEVDANTGLVSLQGEGRDNASVLEFPRQLSQQEAIEQARLISQSQALPGEGGEFPIRFALELRMNHFAGSRP